MKLDNIFEMIDICNARDSYNRLLRSFCESCSVQEFKDVVSSFYPGVLPDDRHRPAMLKAIDNDIKNFKRLHERLLQLAESSESQDRYFSNLLSIFCILQNRYQEECVQIKSIIKGLGISLHSTCPVSLEFEAVQEMLEIFNASLTAHERSVLKYHDIDHIGTKYVCAINLQKLSYLVKDIESGIENILKNSQDFFAIKNEEITSRIQEIIKQCSTIRRYNFEVATTVVVLELLKNKSMIEELSTEIYSLRDKHLQDELDLRLSKFCKKSAKPKQKPAAKLQPILRVELEQNLTSYQNVKLGDESALDLTTDSTCVRPLPEQPIFSPDIKPVNPGSTATVSRSLITIRSAKHHATKAADQSIPSSPIQMVPICRPCHPVQRNNIILSSDVISHNYPELQAFLDPDNKTSSFREFKTLVESLDGKVEQLKGGGSHFKIKFRDRTNSFITIGGSAKSHGKAHEGESRGHILALMKDAIKRVLPEEVYHELTTRRKATMSVFK